MFFGCLEEELKENRQFAHPAHGPYFNTYPQNNITHLSRAIEFITRQGLVEDPYCH